jgi:hypothetical protein
MHFTNQLGHFPQMNDQEALYALPRHHWFHAQALKMLIGHVFLLLFCC